MAQQEKRGYPLATVRRIAAQLRGDPRTIALIILVPVVLVTLLYYIFKDAPTPEGRPPTFSVVGPTMLAVLPMMILFLTTSIVMLRERMSGTLERVLTTPLTRWNLVASYAAVFGVLALVQAAVLAGILLGPMGVTVPGGWPVLFVLAFLDGLLGTAFGILASAFARTEFQAVQFMPVFLGPQVLLCGLFVPVAQMPGFLSGLAHCLPMTWAVDVIGEALRTTDLTAGSWWRLVALAGVSLAALLLAARSMPRRTK